MGRKLRVHELARELGIEPKDLLAKLDSIGLPGKRSQSALEDDEIERIKTEYGRGDRPAVTVGDERITRGSEGETVTERRVRTNVIRRRTTRSADGEGDAVGPPTGQDGAPLASFGEPEPLPAPVAVPPPIPIGETPGAPSMPPPPPLAPPPVAAEAPLPPAPPQPQPPPAPKVEAALPSPALREAAAPVRAPAPPTKVPTTPAPMPTMDSGLRGPRVLGKIDLRKTQPPPKPAPADARANRERPRREGFTPAPAPGIEQPPPPPSEDDARRKKKKRRVIKEADAGELREDPRRGRLPRKKRALPGKEVKKTEITTPKASKRVVKVSGVITVGDLAKAMGVKAAEILRKLMDSGMLATINQLLDADTATLLASDFGYNVENVAFDAESALEDVTEEQAEGAEAETRPPVVTIMGHVDHGKTSLLDAIRSTNVTSQEAGGITQHIGAYSVAVGDRRVTFLDTPGHEAFTAMRARGAKVTDLVVLVVAADDGVMPQTIEAINHARAAGVPIVVAINKVDKPDANLERARQALADHGLVAEEWGGDTICAPVSAKTKEGIPHLLEMLLLQADVLDLKAFPDRLARGTIVEAKLDRGRGPVATVLVQEGTLKKGDPFVCGGNFGRVRAMVDDLGRSVDTAGPSAPVEILGLQGVPEAGSRFVAVADEATARQVAEHRRTKQRESELAKTSKVSLEDLYSQVQAGEVKDLKVVVKADVQGSVEALTDALKRMSTPEVRLNVIHASVGGITESDVLLASASNAVIIGFNIRPEAKAGEVAEREGVDLRLYNIIYDVQNDLHKAMEGMLEPTLREKVSSRSEVRQVFAIPNIGTIAGCYVLDGKVTRNSSCRLVRDSVVVYTGKVTSLRRFKEDAREVQSGYECGIGLEDFLDMKVGDIIETFEMESVERRLSAPAGRPGAAERRA